METWTQYEVPIASLPELFYIGRMSAPNIAGAQLPPHRHDVMEISYLHRGTVRWWVGEEASDLHGGEAYVTFPGELHGGTLKSLAACTLYWIQMPIDAPAARGFLDLPAPEGVRLRASLKQLPRQFAVADLSKLFDRILAHVPTDDELNATRVRADLLTLLLEFIDGARRPSSGMSDVTREAIAVMREELSSRLDVPTLAARLGWSVSYLKQRFRRDVGMGPAEYHLRMRIEQAKERLRATSDPITSIAIELGFSSSQNFATAFKRVTGVRPAAFRAVPDAPIG